MRSMIDRYKLQSLRLSSPFPVFFSRLRQDRYPHWRGTRLAAVTRAHFGAMRGKHGALPVGKPQ